MRESVYERGTGIIPGIFYLSPHMAHCVFAFITNPLFTFLCLLSLLVLTVVELQHWSKHIRLTLVEKKKDAQVATITRPSTRSAERTDGSVP